MKDRNGQKEVMGVKKKEDKAKKKINAKGKEGKEGRL